MNHPLHIARRYDTQIDRALREMESNAPRTLSPVPLAVAARESDEAAQHAVEGLVALAAYVAVVVACVVAVTA